MGDDIVGTRYTCHILSGEQKVLQTQHKNQLSYGITYLVRCSSSYLLVLLCTTNKTGGGRATTGERRRASDVCTPEYSLCTWSCFVAVVDV